MGRFFTFSPVSPALALAFTLTHQPLMAETGRRQSPWFLTHTTRLEHYLLTLRLLRRRLESLLQVRDLAVDEIELAVES